MNMTRPTRLLGLVLGDMASMKALPALAKVAEYPGYTGALNVREAAKRAMARIREGRVK